MFFAYIFKSEVDGIHYGGRKLQTNRGVAEWSIALVLKTSVPRGTGGSNPSSSASQGRTRSVWLFYLETSKACFVKLNK